MEETEKTRNKRVSTLVFMDLETTGLPSDVGARNVHITEMSLIAVDRNNFEIDRNLRVLNKMNLCIRPRSVISPVSMHLTGLYNDILENQEEFDDSVPRMLEYFFRRLQKPICLLAHNGNRFDFPVLQAELNRLNFSLGSDILCADTLVAFRSICFSKKQEVEAKEKIIKCSENAQISDDDTEKLLSDDIECFSQLDIEQAIQQVNEDTLKSNPFEKFSSQNKSHLTEDILFDSQVKIFSEDNKFLSSKHIFSQDKKTPERNQTPLQSEQNLKIHRKRKVLDRTFCPDYQYKKKIIPARKTLFTESARKNLFPDPPFEIHKITRFSLLHLYKHFFNENPPNSHYAETDCISLSKVCQKINKDFLQWVDENNVAFSMIDALW